MSKRHLEAEIRSARGQHDLVLAKIPGMTEAEAGQWYHLLKGVKEDAEDSGRKQGAREWARR